MRFLDGNLRDAITNIAYAYMRTNGIDMWQMAVNSEREGQAASDTMRGQGRIYGFDWF